MAAVDLPAEISSLRTTYRTVREVSDVDALKATVAQLTEQASASDLWDDVENAQAVTSRRSSAAALLFFAIEEAARLIRR